MRLQLAACVFTLFLIGCGETVTFSEPLPIGKSDLNDFPKRFRGSYASEDGVQIVHVEKSLLIREYNYDVRFHVDSMESGTVLSGDTLYWPGSGVSRRATREGDYVTYHVNLRDTIFEIDTDHLLRKAKGYLFLNYMNGKDSWYVESLSLQNGELSFGYITSQEEIELLNEIMEQPSDTVAVSYSPSKKQFRKFIAADGFGTDEKYVKIKK